MSQLRHIETCELPIADIEVEGRLRPVDELGVAAILSTVAEGQSITDPIDVRRVRKGKAESYRLVDGAHRLEAMKRLGRDVIPASVWEGTRLDARLLEIERNLARAEMKPIDRAVFLLGYKDAYEEKYPEAKAAIGEALAAKRWNATGTVPVASFAAMVGQLTGQDESTIRRQINAARHLSKSEIDAVRAAPHWVSFKDIADIGRIGEDDERAFVVNKLASGEAKKASKARKLFASETGKAHAPVDPVEAEFQSLLKAWGRARKSVRDRFLEKVAAETREDEGDGDE
ncbi:MULTISPECIES: ParB N-terminal domain-containing protein [unclassified Marinovum]|uniref:ParB N-terminal domain-containing protein n=1 Tax=unclassified Marinovum TaxID=2647166 RepID=UPI003EDC9512